jgi:hypothetical protein
MLWPLLSIFFAALSFAIYTRLNDEKPIVSVYFEKNSPQEFQAYLTNEDTKKIRKYKIFGDQWRIDAQFIKIKPWANILGLDAHYNLERLEGRYKNIKEQNTNKKLAYALSSNSSINLPQFLIDYNFIIDANYGSSTYKEIKANMLYTVFRTQYGLIIRNKKVAHKNKEKQSFLSKLFD